jgi:hypothetical protein
METAEFPESTEFRIQQSDNYRIARNMYIQAIKTAKEIHWNSSLENTDPKSIFRPTSYTKANLQGLIPIVDE